MLDNSISRSPIIFWETNLFIDNKAVAGAGASIAVENPATEEGIIDFPGASSDQVDEAVACARRAFEAGDWSDDPGLRRACLHKFADLVEKNADKLMAALVTEVGTLISNHATQIGFPLKMLRWFADAAIRERAQSFGRYDGKIPSESILTYRPVGVVAAISAYNYPFLIMVNKLGPLAAAGCTTVVLSSPQAPLTMLMIGNLIRDAGFPPGVVNLLAGGSDVGRALCEHPEVDKISFTGSVAVGEMVMQQAARGIRDVVLELGGKSPAILLPEADFAKVAFPLHARYLRNAGQGCGSPTRLLVPRTRLDEFITVSREAYSRIPVGDPWDPKTMAGPLISEAHRARIEAAVGRAVADGAEIVAGGGRPNEPRGWYMNSTLVGNITNKAPLAREEQFGPVGVLLTYEDEEEAIAIANDSTLGLKAYLFGEVEHCAKLAPRLRAGTILINGGGDSRPDVPMGGFKQSGIGREWGEEGIREFLESQHIQTSAS